MKHDDIAEDKKLIKKAVGMHDKQQHGGKKTGMAGLKKGGPTSMDRKKFGKNMSRAMNQKSSGRGR